MKGSVIVILLLFNIKKYNKQESAGIKTRNLDIMHDAPFKILVSIRLLVVLNTTAISQLVSNGSSIHLLVMQKIHVCCEQGLRLERGISDC